MKERTSYDIEQIKEVLPHRYPFLFLDKVIDVQEGESDATRVGRKAVAIKNVTSNEPFFQGHFPNEPIMPGVLLVEAMAQTGAFASFRGGDKPVRIVIAKILSSRFRRPVVPGDTVTLTGLVKKDKNKLLVLECTASVDGQLVADCEFMAHVTLQSHLDEENS